MFEIFKLAVDALVLRDAQREGRLSFKMIALGVGFAVLLYGTGLPATLLYQEHPQYKPLFIAALLFDAVATIAFFWIAIRWYLKLLKKSDAGS